MSSADLAILTVWERLFLRLILSLKPLIPLVCIRMGSFIGGIGGLILQPTCWRYNSRRGRSMLATPGQALKSTYSSCCMLFVWYNPISRARLSQSNPAWRPKARGRSPRDEGREAGFYWLSQALLLGSTFLFFQHNAGTLSFLINLVPGSNSKGHFLL